MKLFSLQCGNHLLFHNSSQQIFLRLSTTSPSQKCRCYMPGLISKSDYHLLSLVITSSLKSDSTVIEDMLSLVTTDNGGDNQK